ncbi:FAD/NAD(P)-binding domain-containing protein, partial [Caulochytrium protostelioides]
MSHIYDYLVIGGGSGGIASARRAASYGAKTLIIENSNIMYNAAMIRETLGDAKGYGFDVPSRQINWNMLKQKRDAYITRLNGIYERNLDNDKVERVYGLARFVGHNKVQVNDREYEAKHVLIATGSYDMRPTWPGAELSLSSEDFFDIEHLPRHVAVNGAGYIAIELAGIFQYLGCQVSLFIRQGTFLRTFDTMIQTKIMDEYRKAGMEIIPYSKIESLTRTASHPTESVVQNPNAYAHTVEYTNTQTGERKTLEGVNLFLAAIGRKPQTPKLNLSALSDLKYDAKEFIVTNAYQDTHVPNLHALGDVCG